MGRKKHTKMKIKDIQVREGKCIISLEIRRGSNVWKKAYGFSETVLKEGEFSSFRESFEKRVLADALKLEEDKKFEDRVLMRLEDMVDQEILLD